MIFAIGFLAVPGGFIYALEFHEDDGGSVAPTLGLLVSYIVFLAIPRARDAGWSPWIGLLSVAPYIGAIPGVALLLKPNQPFTLYASKSDSVAPSEGKPN